MPSVDLVDMYLRLAEKYNMKFYFGLYDSGRYWDTGDLSWEIEDNKYVIDEVWKMYGEKYKSFGGWYISGEISRATKGAIDAFRAMGKQCKMYRTDSRLLSLRGLMAKGYYGNRETDKRRCGFCTTTRKRME